MCKHTTVSVRIKKLHFIEQINPLIRNDLFERRGTSFSQLLLNIIIIYTTVTKIALHTATK